MEPASEPAKPKAPKPSSAAPVPCSFNVTRYRGPHILTKTYPGGRFKLIPDKDQTRPSTNSTHSKSLTRVQNGYLRVTATLEARNKALQQDLAIAQAPKSPQNADPPAEAQRMASLKKKNTSLPIKADASRPPAKAGVGGIQQPKTKKTEGPAVCEKNMDLFNLKPTKRSSRSKEEKEEIRELQIKLGEKNETIREKNDTIREKNETIREKDKMICDLQHEIGLLRTEINKEKNTGTGSKQTSKISKPNKPNKILNGSGRTEPSVGQKAGDQNSGISDAATGGKKNKKKKLEYVEGKMNKKKKPDNAVRAIEDVSVSQTASAQKSGGVGAAPGSKKNKKKKTDNVVPANENASIGQTVSDQKNEVAGAVGKKNKKRKLELVEGKSNKKKKLDN